VPGKILLDSYRRSSGKGTIDAVTPPFIVWITIVRIEHGARAWLLRSQRQDTE
jgi:hypothetical protein